MRTIIFRLILLLVILTCAYVQIVAQEEPDSTKMWQIDTRDGNTFYGFILSRDENRIQLRTTTLGVINIPAESVLSTKEIGPALIRDGEIWSENPQATRYFFAPNGYGLKKGEGYYQNIWILFNQVSVGITNHTSIGVGMMPLFLFAGAPTPVWVTPKVSIPVTPGKFNLGAGALLGGIIGEGGGFFGIPYGLATVGSRDHHLTFALGYGIAGGEWASSPTMTLSGMTRISRRSFLMSENYLLSLSEDIGGIISIGGRTIWTGVSLDYALVIPVGTGAETFLAIPLIGLVVPFGQKR